MDKEKDKRSVPLKKFKSRRYHQCSIGGCKNLTKDLYSARLRDPFTQTPIYICKYCIEDMGRIYNDEVNDSYMKAITDNSINTTVTNVNIDTDTGDIERNETEAIPGVIYEDTADDSLVKSNRRGRKKQS